MRRFLQKKFLFISVLLFIIFSSVPVFAGEGFAISVSPLIIELELNPGESISKTIEVSSSTSDSKSSISTEIKDFYYNDNDQLQFITPTELEDPELQQFSLKRWISIDETISFQKGRIQEVEFTITAPEDASPGGHYGMILFGQSAGRGAEGTSVGLGGQVAVMLLVLIPGDYSEEGGIVKPLMSGRLSEDKKSFTPRKLFVGGSLFKNGPVDFAFRFENNSAAHVVPEGYIVVRNIFGGVVDQFSLEEKRIFPGTSRSIYAHLEKDFLLGWYIAKLDVTDAEGNHHYSKTSFVGLPLKLSLLILFGIGLIVLFFAFYNKWLTRRILKKYDENNVRKKR